MDRRISRAKVAAGLMAGRAAFLAVRSVFTETAERRGQDVRRGSRFLTEWQAAWHGRHPAMGLLCSETALKPSGMAQAPPRKASPPLPACQSLSKLGAKTSDAAMKPYDKKSRPAFIIPGWDRKPRQPDKPNAGSLAEAVQQSLEAGNFDEWRHPKEAECEHEIISTRP